jgi:hypothetical protein
MMVVRRHPVLLSGQVRSGLAQVRFGIRTRPPRLELRDASKAAASRLSYIGSRDPPHDKAVGIRDLNHGLIRSVQAAPDLLGELQAFVARGGKVRQIGAFMILLEQAAVPEMEIVLHQSLTLIGRSVSAP